MRYEGVVYRPPSEAGSLLIQATIGCPHNQCTFCGMYKEKQFRIRSVADIKEDLNQAQKVYRNTVETLFFPDGNTILMKTSDLVEIIHYAKETFSGYSVLPCMVLLNISYENQKRNCFYCRKVALLEFILVWNQAMTLY